MCYEYDKESGLGVKYRILFVVYTFDCSHMSFIYIGCLEFIALGPYPPSNYGPIIQCCMEITDLIYYIYFFGFLNQLHNSH